MKKVLAVLGAVLAACLVVAAVILGVWHVAPEELPVSSTPPDEASSSFQPELKVYKAVEDYAEMLDALDYETRQNRDTVAWLKVPGTEINNSVLQGLDNAYYLRRDERRQYANEGCYYVDYECTMGGRADLSPNTIIYGHSWDDDPDGVRFGQLFRFVDTDFARTHPCLEFCTQQDPMTWQIFAVAYTNISFDYIHPQISGEEMVEVANTAMDKSFYDYGITVGPEDKILTLSTCVVGFGGHDNRLIVMAKLMDEDAEAPLEAEFTERPEKKQGVQ